MIIERAEEKGSRKRRKEMLMPCILKLDRQGYNSREIAKVLLNDYELVISHATVYRWLRQWKLSQ